MHPWVFRIAPLGIPHRLWDAWLDRRFTHVSSEQIITVTGARLRLPRIARRYRLTEERASNVEAVLRGRVLLIPISASDVMPVTGDPEDDAVLATARLGDAEYLVTGDNGLLALRSHAGVGIVSPRQFMALLPEVL